MIRAVGIPLPETLHNPATYPDPQTLEVEFTNSGGTVSLLKEIGLSIVKNFAASVAIAGICALTMTITGGPMTFFIFALAAAGLNSLLDVVRFLLARQGCATGYSILTKWISPLVMGLFASMTLIPLIHGGLHSLLSALFFQGGFQTIHTPLFPGHSLSPASTELTPFASQLGQTNSQLLCSAFSSLASIISASLLLSLSKQAAKADPELANLLWVTAIGTILGECVNAIMMTITTGNPYYLLILPLSCLAYPLILLFDCIMNCSCCTQRNAAAAAVPALAPPSSQPHAIHVASGDDHLRSDATTAPILALGSQLERTIAAGLRQKEAYPSPPTPPTPPDRALPAITPLLALGMLDQFMTTRQQSVQVTADAQ